MDAGSNNLQGIWRHHPSPHFSQRLNTVILIFHHMWRFSDLQLFLLLSLGFFLWVLIIVKEQCSSLNTALQLRSEQHITHLLINRSKNPLLFFLMAAECCLTSLTPTCVWLHLWTFFDVHWFLLKNVYGPSYLSNLVSALPIPSAKSLTEVLHIIRTRTILWDRCFTLTINRPKPWFEHDFHISLVLSLQ